MQKLYFGTISRRSQTAIPEQLRRRRNISEDLLMPNMKLFWPRAVANTSTARFNLISALALCLHALALLCATKNGPKIGVGKRHQILTMSLSLGKFKLCFECRELIQTANPMARPLMFNEFCVCSVAKYLAASTVVTMAGCKAVNTTRQATYTSCTERL